MALAATLALVGCRRQPPVIEVGNPSEGGYSENMVNANKYIAQAEATSIQAYIARRNWPMTQMANGAWVWVYQKGDGTTVNADDSLVVNYRMEAINGMTIYEQVSDTIVAGHRQTIVGLDDALVGLTRGSRLRLVLPSSLGYGIAGDGDRVPRSAVLIIDATI